MALIDDLKERRKAANELHHEFMRNAFTWQSNADIEAQLVRDLDIAIAALTPAPAPVEIEIPAGFTKWEGGECPVDPNTCISVMFLDGEISHDGVIAGNMNWAHDATCAVRIYAYKITEQASAQDDASPFVAQSPVVWTVPGAGEESRDQSPDEQDDASEFADDGTPAEHISILTGDPAIEPESGLHGEASETYYPTLEEQAIFTKALFASAKVIESQSAQPSAVEAPALNEAMQDEREQSVEGYAPVVAVDEAPLTEEIGGVLYEVPTGSNNAPVTNPEADALARAHDYYDPKAVADRERNAGLARLFAYNPFYKPKVEA